MKQNPLLLGAAAGIAAILVIGLVALAAFALVPTSESESEVEEHRAGCTYDVDLGGASITLEETSEGWKSSGGWQQWPGSGSTEYCPPATVPPVGFGQ